MAADAATVVAAAALLLVHVQLGRSCDEEGAVLICTSLPPYFGPGYSTLIMYLGDVGEINATAFGSDNLTSVTRLVINGAGVTAVADGAFASLRGLTRLSLNHNALTRISAGWFARPSVLRELNLTGNRIEAVTESTLSGLVNLTKLALNRNEIATVAPHALSSGANLAELDLSDNRLTRMSPQVFGSTRLRLGGNPWDCTCDAEASVASVKELWSRSLLDAPVQVTCETPPRLRGKPVWNVSVCDTGLHGPTPPASSGASAAPGSTATTRAASETRTSARPEPTHVTTTTTLTTDGTSSPPTPPSGTRTSVQPKPSDVTEPSSGTSCALVVVTAVSVCVLLSLLCFLAALHRRKRGRKTVRPGRAEPQGGGGSGPHPPPGRSETRWSGPRAKSADAVLVRWGKDHVGLQKEPEAQAGDTENAAASEAEPVTQPESVTDPEGRADAARDPVPYLSIGANPGDTGGHGPGQRSLKGRVSTWPPTAAQWQARCERKREEVGSDVRPQHETCRFTRDTEEFGKEAEPGAGSDRAQKEGDGERCRVVSRTTNEARAMPRSESGSGRADVEAGFIQDSASGRLAEGDRHRGGREAAAHPAAEAGQRRGPTRQRGASPGDAALPFAFMDLLHEVVQNNGRWTRERWKQIHGNGQRR